MPKPKRTKTKTLGKQLDDITGKIVRARGFCEHCGSTEKLQWAHIIGRSARNVRWDLDNAFCLCHPCHFRFTNWPHSFYAFVGQERYSDLMRRANNFDLKPDRKVKLAYLQEYARENNIDLG